MAPKVGASAAKVVVDDDDDDYEDEPSALDYVLEFLESTRGRYMGLALVVLEFFLCIVMLILYIVTMLSTADDRAAMALLNDYIRSNNRSLQNANNEFIFRLAMAEANDMIALQELTKEAIEARDKILAFAKKKETRQFFDVYFYISHDRKTWPEARQICERLGSLLASFPTLEEQHFLKKEMDALVPEYYWIGVYRTPDDHWNWILPSIMFSHSYWQSDPPEKQFNAGGSNCAALMKSCQGSNCWLSFKCTERTQYICRAHQDVKWI
ncbi:C-type lectin domain family 4 member M-like isoform X1 [Hemicordylus capensis]|uniref:C-type lectin domain family 4 member M-like isoform X1 n=1 Tax=Hemicordylus capensis TaxID=884348 RepID=UPI0023031573|nr:C-type lectin domain family 4 member M-like isoform X1 [Hemicordylus capensis]